MSVKYKNIVRSIFLCVHIIVVDKLVPHCIGRKLIIIFVLPEGCTAQFGVHQRDAVWSLLCKTVH